MRVRFVGLAKREVFQASRHYDAQAPGLGDAFLDELKRLVDLVKQYPAAWPIVLGEDIRRARLNRFPYAITYRQSNAGIVIFAVAHLKRRPNYRQRRVTDD